MNTEYSSLRREMLRWQDRRFDLLKLSTSVVSGLLGFRLVMLRFDEGDSARVLWPLISSVLLLYLAGTSLLTWYAGVANSKIASYIKVFHDNLGGSSDLTHWESRLAALKSSGQDSGNLNRWIVVVYVTLGVVSVVLPYAAAGFAAPGPWLYALAVCAAPFLATIVLVACYSYPRERFENMWIGLREEERSRSPADSSK